MQIRSDPISAISVIEIQFAEHKTQSQNSHLKPFNIATTKINDFGLSGCRPMHRCGTDLHLTRAAHFPRRGWRNQDVYRALSRRVVPQNHMERQADDKRFHTRRSVIQCDIPTADPSNVAKMNITVSISSYLLSANICNLDI